VAKVGPEGVEPPTKGLYIPRSSPEVFIRQHLSSLRRFLCARCAHFGSKSRLTMVTNRRAISLRGGANACARRSDTPTRGGQHEVAEQRWAGSVARGEETRCQWTGYGARGNAARPGRWRRCAPAAAGRQDPVRVSPWSADTAPHSGCLLAGSWHDGLGFLDQRLQPPGGVCTMDWPSAPKTALLKDFGSAQLKRIAHAGKRTGPSPRCP
jgi:hypothetical protein